jgi:RsmE family RNA methyltransferase
MNRLIIFPPEKTNPLWAIGDDLTISDKRVIDHLLYILRLKAGHTVKLTFLDFGLGEGVISKIEHGLVMIRITALEKNTFIGPFKLILGLCRPPTLKKIFEYASSFGVHEFHIFQARLSEKSYATSHILKQEEYTPYLLRGLEQAAYWNQLPTVHFYTSLQELISSINFTNERTLLCSPLASQNLFQHLKTSDQRPSTLVIGPERGLTVREEQDFLIQPHSLPVHLGPSLLRVEMAVLTALGTLSLM